MLYMADQYVMLDMTDVEGFVKGQIFPVVLPNVHDGIRYPFRYEDFLFLQEAKLERKYWRKGVGQMEKIKPMGRMRLRAADFLECVCDEDANWGFADPDKRWIYNDDHYSFQIKYPGDWTLRDATAFLEERWNWLHGEDCGIEKVDLGRVRKTAHLKKAYDNLSRYVIAAETRDDFVAPWLYNGGRSRRLSSSGGGGYESESTVEDWNNNADFSYQSDAHVQSNGFWYTNLTQSEHYNGTFIKPQFAKRMCAVFNVQVIFEQGASYKGGAEWIDIVAIPYYEAAPAQEIYRLLMSKVLEKHGRKFMETPQKADSEWENTAVYTHGISLFVENDFPATPPENN